MVIKWPNLVRFFESAKLVKLDDIQNVNGPPLMQFVRITFAVPNEK